MRRPLVTALSVLIAGIALGAPAQADFPYAPHLAPGVTPNDFRDNWKIAASPEPLSDNPIQNSQIRNNPQELGGVRGAALVDSDKSLPTAWEKTTGRPDVTIAVLDSGIEWDNKGAMTDLRRKVRLNRGELPRPNHRRTTSLEPGVNCSAYANAYDADRNGVFNVEDYACDTRVSLTDPRRVGPPGVLVPQDITIAFSDGRDADHNGYVDDIAGWDFVDNDNDPYDDVQYGHGTGEARDSNAEANNGEDLGTCPNCTVLPLRVGESFIADSARFGEAVTYGVDNGVLVIQEALGAINNTRLSRDAVDYAYRHGVVVIASAADEAAQHHNWPSSLPHVIVVNSVNKYDDTFTPQPRSYLQFNGCTNFSSKITLAIPSSSCSSNATGNGAGMAGLLYAAALDAIAAHKLSPHPTCRLVNGKRCPLSANEVRQLMATGIIGQTPVADDVDFESNPNGNDAEPSCSPTPRPGCTDPNGSQQSQATAHRPVISPLPTTKTYPARRGPDQFFGYGRVNMARVVREVLPDRGSAQIPPEVEITSPDWFAQVDPRRASFALGAQIADRGGPYTCRVLVAPGSYPNNSLTTDNPPGDFAVVPSSFCDGHTAHKTAFNGTVARISIPALRARFPSDAGNFNGPLPPAYSQLPNRNGRPNSEPYGFTVWIQATATGGTPTLTGQDRRNLYLHHDSQLLSGFPRHLASDGESMPLLVDLDGDDRNELVFGTADGYVHAIRPNGRELRGWPVRTDRFPFHLGSRAFRTHQVASNEGGAILGPLSAGSLHHDGVMDVVATDYEGHVYAWDPHGRRVFHAHTNVNYSGKPLRPFVNSRHGETNRTQRGFLTGATLADLDGDGTLELIAGSMDKHLYAWHPNGRLVRGFPVQLYDRTKVKSVDPRTHELTFRDDSGSYMQGGIVDEPAVGDLDGDRRPEILVGTNEEYRADKDGGINAGNQNTTSLGVVGQLGVLSYANSRVYAVHAQGNRAKGGPFLKGWPFKVGILDAELLPDIGEGITGSPVIGPVDCPSGGKGAKAGFMPDAGLAYVVNPDATSCYGNDSSNGKPVALATDFSASLTHSDAPDFAAVGQPAFGAFPGGIAFLGPVAGLQRALDLVLNEYQGGQDFVAAWDAATGQYAQGFPSAVDDLEFLTGPSVADIDGQPGEEVIGGTAYLDLYAVSSANGMAISGWPKLTSDWVIANPTIGSFGTRDNASSARKVVIALTRSGTVLAYRTTAPACSPSSWPRFHHDLASSGDYSRDATPPGRPLALTRKGRTVRWRAPGDDELCGTARRYELALSARRPVTAAGFTPARRMRVTVKPAAPGTAQTLTLPRGFRGYAALRAVDEQGNVGLPAAFRVR